MTTNKNGNQFREDEIVILKHYDKRKGEWVENSYPKVGGRLRLAHEDNESLNVSTEVIRYDESIAVVSAIVETMKGQYHGIGMASHERDKSIAPAILELAETRAIARALRFAGYGVEYCSAEEISHLENGNGNGNGNGTRQHGPAENNESYTNNAKESEDPGHSLSTPGNGNGNGTNGGNGQSGRITNKQMGFIINLGKGLGMNSKDLDEETIAVHGVKLSHLTTKEASSFIDYLQHQKTGR